MTAPPFPAFDREAFEDDARRAVEALADNVVEALRVAHALIRDGSRIDLAGLDDLFGLLCARALDLRPDHARRLEPRLLTLLDDLDLLSAASSPPHPIEPGRNRDRRRPLR